MPRLFHSLFFVLICLASWGQPTLHYNLKIGDKFVVEQNATQYITQQIEGVSHELENNIRGLMEFEVTAIKENIFEIDMSFLDLGMRMKSNLQGELMDVNARELIDDNVQSKIFNSLLNVPIQIVLAKSGNIIEVNGGDSLITKMTDAAGLTDEPSKNALKESLRGEFGSEALSSSFEQMTYIYPEHTDSITNQWENEYSGKLSAKNLWKLETVTNSQNHITGEADITMNIVSTGTSMSLTGKQETTITADAKSGFILNMQVEGFSEGTAITDFTGDTEIPTTVRSITTYKLIQD
ncbi:MAG: DUF6263 family protein [Flavobacteriaceae bacterium]